MKEPIVYASYLEKKLIDEFKEKFEEKMGYVPVVVTRVNIDKRQTIHLMSLEKLKSYFMHFAPVKCGEKVNIFSSSRTRDLVELRMIFCFLASQMKYTYTTIGRFIGNRDHTTVLHNLKTFNNLIDTDENFKQKYLQIISYINDKYESPIMDQFIKVQHQSELALLP